MAKPLPVPLPEIPIADYQDEARRHTSQEIRFAFGDAARPFTPPSRKWIDALLRHCEKEKAEAVRACDFGVARNWIVTRGCALAAIDDYRGAFESLMDGAFLDLVGADNGAGQVRFAPEMAELLPWSAGMLVGAANAAGVTADQLNDAVAAAYQHFVSLNPPMPLFDVQTKLWAALPAASL